MFCDHKGIFFFRNQSNQFTNMVQTQLTNFTSQNTSFQNVSRSRPPRPQRLKDHPEYEFMKISLGYISVVVSCVIFSINIFMITIFFRAGLRKPVHKILISIALIENLSIIVNLIPSIYFYTLGHGEEYTHFDWCLPQVLLSRTIPGLCRTWSLNLMVLLALQGLLVLVRPYHVNSYFTPKKTVAMIFVVGIVACGANVPMILKLDKHSKYTVQSFILPNITIFGCLRERTKILGIQISDILFVLFSKVIPIATLVFLDICLLVKLHRITRRRSTNLGMQKQQICRQNSQSNRLTSIISIIISCILLVDVPGLVLHTYILYSGNISCRMCQLDKLFSVIYILELMAFSSSFTIYSCMSRSFRISISRCLTPKSRLKEQTSNSLSIQKLSVNNKS